MAARSRVQSPDRSQLLLVASTLVAP
uniref:Uncharacterized protein n=1 Tax=Romanomermis culicivorax TaxID=13658 RepID=A0A915HHE2_ROMCU